MKYKEKPEILLTFSLNILRYGVYYEYDFISMIWNEAIFDVYYTVIALINATAHSRKYYILLQWLFL